MKLNHQLDLFLPNPTEEDLAHFKGKIIKPGVELLNAPWWNAKEGRWEGLANVGGALCIVELSIKTLC